MLALNNSCKTCECPAYSNNSQHIINNSTLIQPSIKVDFDIVSENGQQNADRDT